MIKKIISCYPGQKAGDKTIYKIVYMLFGMIPVWSYIVELPVGDRRIIIL